MNVFRVTLLICFIGHGIMFSQIAYYQLPWPHSEVKSINFKSEIQKSICKKNQIANFRILEDSLFVQEVEFLKVNQKYPKSINRIHKFILSADKDSQNLVAQVIDCIDGYLIYSKNERFISEQFNSENISTYKLYQNYYSIGKDIPKLRNSTVIGWLDENNIFCKLKKQYYIYSLSHDSLQVFNKIPEHFYVSRLKPYSIEKFILEIKSNDSKFVKLLTVDNRKVKTIFSSTHPFDFSADSQSIIILSHFSRKLTLTRASWAGKILERVDVLRILNTIPLRYSAELAENIQESKIMLSYFDAMESENKTSGCYVIDINSLKALRRVGRPLIGAIKIFWLNE